MNVVLNIVLPNSGSRKKLKLFRFRPEATLMSGQEFAGIVEEVGSKVTALKVGDAVLGHKMPFRVRYRLEKTCLRDDQVFFISL